MKKLFTIMLLVVFLASCAGMGQNQKTGTAVGGFTGTAAGAAIGHAYGGTTGLVIGGLIGLIVGGVVGNQIGTYMDKQERALQAALASSIAANQASVQRSNNILMTTFRSDVFFDKNSSVLKVGSSFDIDRVANVLNQYASSAVQIQGHTDDSGSEDYNLKLSKARADSVKRILQQKGVNQRRLSTIGFGSSQPISSNPAQNRRVTIVIVPIEQVN